MNLSSNMDQVNGTNVHEPFGLELSDIGIRSLSSSFRRFASSFRSNSSAVHTEHDVDNEYKLKWAQVERLPTFERLRSSLFGDDGDSKGKQVIDVTSLGALERQLFIEKIIKHVEHDNLRLLQKFRERIDKVGVKLSTVEIRYKNLHVKAECEVVHGKPLPSLWNSLQSIVSDSFKMFGLKSEEAVVTILDDVSGIIKPGRITLLLGPPGCGKTSFLKSLSRNLDKDLKVAGEVSYNGYKLKEFIPQKTSAYISQRDVHISEMTVRETLDFSAHCQGVGSRAEIMAEVSRREKQQGIIPDPDIDTFMKAISVEGQKTTLQTNYLLKILGLDICADTLVGNAMRRGISGGQKKRLTTGEMLAGPTTVLLMDEISNGLDSSTTYQIVASLQQLAHITDATIVVALLQPAPEVFNLFDDIILMAEGKIVYHGPHNDVLGFFLDCGFKCPERKGVADFLQEVLSRKDQAPYWNSTEQAYEYVSIDQLSRKFKESHFGKILAEEILEPFVKSQSHTDAISFSKYSLSKWTLLRACMSREVLLMKRNYFVYVFKSTQLFIVSSIAMTVFLRTQMSIDVLHSNYYLGAMFYGLIQLFFDAMPEMTMTVARLDVFYRQRDLYLYPAWAYAIPAAILKIPVSFLQSLIWTSLTYFVIGFSPEAGRFFRQLLLFFFVHLAAMSMFRFLASLFRTVVATLTFGSTATICVYLFGGFIIPKASMPVWLKWGFWVSPMTYGEIGLAVNEFSAPRWQHVKTLSTNITIGQQTLTARGLDFNGYFVWISLGALFGMSLLLNFGFTLALTFLDSPRSRAIVSSEKLSHVEGSLSKKINEANKGRTILPFQPLTVSFQDVQYYIDTPRAMRERGFSQKRLQLLCDTTGALKPGVLTALMGVSGAGKTTLLDVLSGRKTIGTIEGEIRIGGYPKVQQTFSRISGYCEQTDIHSSGLTVEESVIFSAWLRLDPQIDSKIKYGFVKEVLEIIELDEMKDSLVGTAGISGLSTEQRKRLTVAVELVANPSVIFMDEPTTGLDARAAAIVMRAVKNIADTGRTIVCTIHQPSIDIFESFDELILLKAGGRIIYSGPLGQHSNSVIEYFESISGVPKIRSNYNPATWMLEVTSTSSEVELGVDFAQIYKNSNLYERNKELVMSLSSPPSGSKPLSFPTRFSQNAWGQYKSCLWKLHLSYWRSPSYNLKRILYTVAASLFFGTLFWGRGKKINNQQDLFIISGSIFVAAVFLGINNCASVIPYVTMERTVVYRERFAGMYASWAYTLAQVTTEFPYIFIQALAYVVVTYPMIGYHWSFIKVFYYLYTIFCTLLYYSYLGMLLVSVTPTYDLSSILAASCYAMFSLFSGFILPKPQIPKWWKWIYYLVPSSWTLNAMLTSQYGDMEKKIMVFEEKKTIKTFLGNYFGYDYDQLPFVAIALAAYPILYASLFNFCIWKLSFQKR